MTCKCGGANSEGKCNCHDYVFDCSNNKTITFANSTPVIVALPLTETLPHNFVINGFSIKEVVTEVIKKHHRRDTGIHYYEPRMPDDYTESLAEEIQEAFAVKLGLKQGEIK